MALADWSKFDRPATGSQFREALYTLWAAVSGLLSSTGSAQVLMTPNKITSTVTIPDGYNAVMFGDFEISPDASIICEGNSTLTILG